MPTATSHDNHIAWQLELEKERQSRLQEVTSLQGALKEQTRLPTRPPSRHTRAPTRPAHIRVAAPAPAPVCAQALSTSRHLGQCGRRRRRESLRSPDEMTTSMGGVGAVALEHNVVNPQMCARRS